MYSKSVKILGEVISELPFTGLGAVLLKFWFMSPQCQQQPKITQKDYNR